ncbi:LPS export ABC transporter permease LptG [bacterium]|nr:LPS export ABC transporter permease LptG [bacterium]
MIDRYLRRAVFALIAVVGLALFAISSFVTLVTELEDLGKGTYGLLQILRYVGLSAPETVYQIFPIIALLGTLMGLGALASSHELTAIRAAGVSIGRIAWGVAKAGVVVGALAFAVGEFLLPMTVPAADQGRAEARYGDMASNSASGVWLRDGQRFVHIAQLGSASEIEGLELFEIDDEGRLQSTTRAATGRYSGDGWTFEDIQRTQFGPGGTRVQREASASLANELSERFAPDVLRLFVLEADALSARGLWRYVEYLNANSLDSERHALAFWRKVSVPVTVLVMMLVAVPFVIGSNRQAGAGQRLFVGVMVGVGFYMVNEVTASTGLLYGLSPALSAFLPTAAVALIVALRLRTMR